MGLLRNVLLAGSRSRWLRERATRWPVVRRAVSRFMPGEDLDAALTAARALRSAGIGAVLTRLGENLSGPGEAEQVTRHYLDVLDRARRDSLDVEISIKPTQLGLEFSPAGCAANFLALAEKARATGTWVWIDMESSAITDATLDLYRAARSRHPNVGVCLQAYLRRTAGDLESLIPGGGGIRLVKGAYLEPPRLAFPKRREVDANFLALAARLLAAPGRRAGVRTIFGTHDAALIRRIEALGRDARLGASDLEFQMLYGIARGEQTRLAGAGHRFRVLISYGDAWFPWYMRRLAERPANLLFVVRNLFRS